MPPTAALLHLQCELVPALRPALLGYWDDFHFAELLSLPGFLWARRGHLIAPDGASPIVTMYGLADPAAADQPRPASFTLLPPELDGRVTFRRRILQAIPSDSSLTGPVGESFVQLIRPASVGDDFPAVAAAIRRWPGVLSVSCWRSVVNAPHTARSEVVHLRDAELIHAELVSGDMPVSQALSRVGAELAGWEAGAYRYAPSSTTSPS
jgi:hypothetical protein